MESKSFQQKFIKNRVDFMRFEKAHGSSQAANKIQQAKNLANAMNDFDCHETYEKRKTIKSTPRIGAMTASNSLNQGLSKSSPGKPFIGHPVAWVETTKALR
jgi:hypothetical protein